jgi:hypothetical protein
MRCKIVRFQKLMWRNMMRSTKSEVNILSSRKSVQCTGKLLKIKYKLILISFTSFVDFFFFFLVVQNVVGKIDKETL